MDMTTKINYIEIPTNNLKATQKFLEDSFGWTFTLYSGDYASFHGAGIDGGITEQTPVTDGILIVLYHPDIEAIQRTVERNGAEITTNLFPFPGGQRFHFRLPYGPEMAIWSEREQPVIPEVQLDI